MAGFSVYKKLSNEMSESFLSRLKVQLLKI